MKILLIDDHVVIRQVFAQALALLPGFQVVGGASSLKSGLELYRQTEPDIIVLDLNLNGASGLDLLEMLHEEESKVRCLIFSGVHNPDVLQRTLDLGAKGIVEKTSTFQELTDAMNAIAAGGTYLSPSVAKILPQSGPRPGGETLTQRERTVLKFFLEDLGDQQIAIKLGIGTQTVQGYRSRITQKTGLKSPAEWNKLGVQLGLIKAR